MWVTPRDAKGVGSLKSCLSILAHPIDTVRQPAHRHTRSPWHAPGSRKGVKHTDCRGAARLPPITSCPRFACLAHHTDTRRSRPKSTLTRCWVWQYLVASRRAGTGPGLRLNGTGRARCNYCSVNALRSLPRPRREGCVPGRSPGRCTSLTCRAGTPKVLARKTPGIRPMCPDSGDG